MSERMKSIIECVKYVIKHPASVAFIIISIAILVMSLSGGTFQSKWFSCSKNDVPVKVNINK